MVLDRVRGTGKDRGRIGVGKNDVDQHRSPRQLHALSQQLDLTIGGAFKLFGYSLESMRQLDFVLNGVRTRIIETYPFFRDRLVEVPAVLGEERAFLRTSFLSELVRSWQRNIPIREIHGRNWRGQKLIYAQIGTNDGIALPRIPPGSVIGVSEIDASELASPDPERYYFLQHQIGYTCSRCIVDKGRLLLITRGERVDTPMEFVYPGQVRIIGRVLWFATKLPIPRPGPLVSRISRSQAPLILPWEHKSFSDLLAAEGMRFGITTKYVSQIGDLLEQHLGVRMSTRTLRRYERGNADHMPRTGVLLALVAIHSLRSSDVFRLLHMWRTTKPQLSLKTLMGLKGRDERRSLFDPVLVPEPIARWQQLLQQWGEWPVLVSTNYPRPTTRVDNLVRLHLDKQALEFNPIFNSGSIIGIDDDDTVPPRNGVIDGDAWNRPLYAFRIATETLHGYLETGATHLAIQPNPSAGRPRRSFHRNQIRVLGRIVEVVSTL